MKVILAALTSTALVLASAPAQNDQGHEGLDKRAQEHGKPHAPLKGETPRTPAPSMAGPNRREPPPGVTPRSRPDLGMNRQGPFDHPDRGGRGRGGGRPDFNQFHGNVHAQRRFHAGPWHPPRDYHYQRWSYGQRLPALYFGSSFWITSFALYGLMAPPPDTIWVRSGPDALLVDRDTGEIIRVEYDVFY